MRSPAPRALRLRRATALPVPLEAGGEGRPCPGPPAVAVASSMKELYRLVLVETPLAPYFSECLTSDDLDEMNIEIMRNTLYKAYLEDFYKVRPGTARGGLRGKGPVSAARPRSCTLRGARGVTLHLPTPSAVLPEAGGRDCQHHGGPAEFRGRQARPEHHAQLPGDGADAGGPPQPLLLFRTPLPPRAVRHVDGGGLRRGARGGRDGPAVPGVLPGWRGVRRGVAHAGEGAGCH